MTRSTRDIYVLASQAIAMASFKSTGTCPCHPTDSHGFAPIVRPPHDLFQEHWHMSPHSRDSLAFVPTSTPPNGLLVQHWHMSTRPRDSLAFAPTSTPPNGLHEQHWHMSTYPRDSLGFSAIVALPNGLHEQHWHMCDDPRGNLGFWPIVAPSDGHPRQAWSNVKQEKDVVVRGFATVCTHFYKPSAKLALNTTESVPPVHWEAVQRHSAPQFPLCHLDLSLLHHCAHLSNWEGGLIPSHEKQEQNKSNLE